MRLRLRAILLVLAVILFLLAALMNENRFEFMAFGLAVFAASFVVDELVGGSWFGRR